MAAGTDTDPSEFLKHHQDKLAQVIVSAGIQNVANKCEQQDLLKGDEKERILNEATGKLDQERANMLLKNIRASFIKVDDHSDIGTLEKFLCVLLEKSNGAVRPSITRIARNCKLVIGKLLKNKCLLSHSSLHSWGRAFKFL